MQDWSWEIENIDLTLRLTVCVLGGASWWRVHTSAGLEFLHFSGPIGTPHYCLAFLLLSLSLSLFSERASSHPLTRPASAVMYVMMMMHLRFLIDRARPWRTGCINWPSGSLCRFSEVGVASALPTHTEERREKGQTWPSQIPSPPAAALWGFMRGRLM